MKNLTISQLYKSINSLLLLPHLWIVQQVSIDSTELLRRIVFTIHDKAITEMAYSALYADLCIRLMCIDYSSLHVDDSEKKKVKFTKCFGSSVVPLMVFKYILSFLLLLCYPFLSFFFFFTH